MDGEIGIIGYMDHATSIIVMHCLKDHVRKVEERIMVLSETQYVMLQNSSTEISDMKCCK